MNIAVCFWGLVRSGKWTHENIKKQLDILRTFANVTVFMHTYKIFSKYSNQWGNEKNIKLDNDEYKLFNPDHFIFDDQDEIKKTIDFEKYHSQPDLHGTNYETVNNIVLALYSQKRVTDLMLRHHKTKNYTHVVYMRPDVLWETDLKEKYFDLDDKTVVSPHFSSKHHTSTRKFEQYLNDRFAICKPNVAEVYGRRYKFLLSYSKQNEVQSEIFCYDVLKAHNIDIVFRWVCFNRVRANGNISKDCKSKY